MDKARKSELNRAYREKNRDRIREQRRRYLEKCKAERAHKPKARPNRGGVQSPELAAIIMLLQRAQEKSGVSMPEFVQALRGAASNATWRELSEVYQIWRDTDEGQRLIGDS